MPEYLSPGVYVEEVDAGPKPIAGVSTSTTGMVGVTAKGPTSGKPQLVTSFAEFTSMFGGYLPDPPTALQNIWAIDPVEGARWWRFPLSVKGYFDNGGQRLFVKRVFASTAAAASAQLGKGLIAHVTADAASGASTLKLEHLFGISGGSAVKLYNGDTGQQIGPDFNVTAYNAASGQATLNAQLPAAAVQKRGDFIEVNARSASPVPAGEATLEFDAISLGAWGNDLSVQARPVPELTLSLLADAAAGNPVTTTVTATAVNAGVWTITVANVAGLNNGDRVQIQGSQFVIGNLSGANRTFDVAPGGQNWPAGTPVRRIRPANAANATTVSVLGAGQLYVGALVEIDNGTNKEHFTVAAIAGQTVTLSGQLANVYYEGNLVRSIGIALTVTYGADGTTENFGPLRLFDDGTTNYVVRNVNAVSQLVRLKTMNGFSSSDITKFPTTTTGAPVTFSNGDDQLSQLSVDDFVGVDAGSGARTGIQALEDIDEVSIVAVPNVWSATVRSALITHCETLRDRFAIIDPKDGLSIEGIQATREPLDTKYAALYHPWLVVRNPLSRSNVWVAPSGHMAGIYAQTDVDRGVFKAPANVVIRSIEQIAQDVTKREQDLLNPKGINVLRAFPNLGERVWGARTLSSDQSWKYVNVRRLFIFVEKSIELGTQWVVFEPNDEPLWARVRLSVSNFLDTVWRSGALQGVKPADAYFVVCDRTTMTQTDIDNGLLICVIGIAPVEPAEFVIFRIQQKTNALVPA